MYIFFNRVKYFPFDVQSCPFRYLPENMLAQQVYLRVKQSWNMPYDLPSNEWNLFDMTVQNVVISIPNYINNHSVEFFTAGVVCFHLQRDPAYYIAFIIIPSTLLCLMSFVQFSAPPDSGERVSLGVSMVLGLTVFQLLIADTLPTSSKESSLIRMYLSSTFILACLSVPISILNINTAYGDHRLFLLKYSIVRKILLEKLPSIFCMMSYSEKILSECTSYQTQSTPLPLEKDDVTTISCNVRVKTGNQVQALPEDYPRGIHGKKLSYREKVGTCHTTDYKVQFNVVTQSKMLS